MKFMIFFLGLLALSSCKLHETDLSVKYKSGAKASLNSASIQNGSLVLQGENLENITSVKLKNDLGFEESFSIDQKSSSQLVASAMRAVEITADAVFSLVLSSAHGSSSFQIQVALSDLESSSILTKGKAAPDTASLTGTVSVDPAGVVVTGTGTAFLSELSRGDLVTIEGESARVKTIASDSSMEISKAHVAGALDVSATYLENPMDVKDKNGNQILALNNNGYLGIFRGASANGKPSSPLGALHIANGASQLVMTDTDDPIGASNSHWYIRPNDSGASSLWIGAANDELESLAGSIIYMKFNPHTYGGGINNSRVTIGSVEENGHFNVRNEADQIATVIRGVAGQTQDLLQIRSSGSAVGDLLTVAANGGVGIGFSNPGANGLEVNGSVSGVGPYQDVSDERFKKDITLIDEPLEKLKKLNGYYYQWRNNEYPDKNFKQTRDLGVIAQEVEISFPEAVYTDKNGHKTVAYARLVAPLIEAVKQMDQESKRKDREIERLKGAQFLMKKQLDEMKKDLKSLKSHKN